MSERKINTEELAIKYGIMRGYTIHSNPKLAEENFNKFLKEFSKQLLELAAENAKMQSGNCYGEDGELYASYPLRIDKQSIINTIKQVE